MIYRLYLEWSNSYLQTAWFWFQIRSAGLPWGFLMHSPAVHGRWTMYFRQERMAKKRQTLRDVSQNSSMFPWFILKIHLDTPTCTCNILRKLLAILRVGWESSTRNFWCFDLFANGLENGSGNGQHFQGWEFIQFCTDLMCFVSSFPTNFEECLWPLCRDSSWSRGEDPDVSIKVVVWSLWFGILADLAERFRQKNATSSPRRLRVNIRIPFESSTRHWKWWIWKGHQEGMGGFQTSGGPKWPMVRNTQIS